MPFSWPAGKPGLLVVQVTEDAPFSGYVGNKEASEKKLLRNVFVEGDVYLDTGDLLVMDEDGFLYFTDRVGDTFRYSTKLRVNPGSLEEITHTQDWMTLVKLKPDECQFCLSKTTKDRNQGHQRSLQHNRVFQIWHFLYCWDLK